MPLLFSNPFFSQEMIRALNWTLIHSLWQGMLLALVAGSIIFFTKKKSPALRYNLLTGALLVFITGIAITFGTLLIKREPVADALPAITVSAPLTMQQAMPTEPANRLPVIGKVVSFFNSNAGWIVLCWLLIILFRCIRLSAGLYGVYQLKRKQTFSPGKYWNARVRDLSRRLQITRPVRLLQSGIAVMPSVIGFFKPVILFPAGMLASLPPNEVEAILLHELAHIRREDFLVNMLQHIVEIIFFFNPAVGWVSSQIRLERENCCDDIAVSQTHNNKLNYVNALMAFQNFPPQPALQLTSTFAGEKNHLINRVKRIIYNNNNTLNNMEKKFLAAGMVITTIAVFAFSTNNLKQQPVKNIAATEDNRARVTTINNDTIPGRDTEHMDNSNSIITRSVNGKKYKIVTENNKVSALYVNGKKIPAEKIGAYKSVTNKIFKQLKTDQENSELDLENSQQTVEEADINQEENQKEQAEAKIDMEKAELQMQEGMRQVNKEMEQSNKVMDESKQEMEQAKLKMEQAMMDYKADKAQPGKEMRQAKQAMEQAKKNMLQIQKQMEQSKIDVARSMKEIERSRLLVAQSKQDMERTSKFHDDIAGDLIAENIIKDRKELTSYKFSAKELIVNGIEQPEAIHQRLKEKYLAGDKSTMVYYYNYHEEIK